MSQELALRAVLVEGHIIDWIEALAVLLSLFSDGSHGLHGLKRILARRRLAAQHQRVGIGIDGIGNIGHLGARRARVGNHRMEHLRSHDDRLMMLNTFADNHTLNARNALHRHLDAKVAACHHDAIAGLDDLINVVDALLVFNLRDNLDVGVMLVENLLHLLHIGRRAHETVGDEVDVFVDGQQNVAAVALGECGQVDMLAGHVDALVGAQHAVVLYLSINRWADNLLHLHVDGAVVEENIVARLHVVSEVGIRHIDDVVRGSHLRPAEDFHHFAGLIVDGVFHVGGANLRSLGIDEDADMGRHRPDVAYNLAYAIGGGVGSVHTHHVHACIEKTADEINVASAVTDGTHYLCLLHG